MTESDMDLLQDYRRTRSNDVFAALVRRHVDLVFSAAHRQVRSKELAEEITQAVFVDLAQAASKLRPDTILPAWLYAVTRRRSVDLIRRETRRRAREVVALKDFTQMNDDASRWRELEPLLDDAMAELEERDRAAIVLRYFKNQPLRQVGQALGVSEDTAQKRVARALDRLRDCLAARGAVSTSAAVATAITANAVLAAPPSLVAGLGAGVAAHALVGGAIFMTTLQKLVVATLVSAGLGTAVFESFQAKKVSKELQSLKASETARTAELRAFRDERESLVARAAALEDENRRLRQNSAELARLRAEVTRLSEGRRDQAAVQGFAEVAKDWKEKEGKLRRLMEAQPAQHVPEMELLNDRVWLDIARDADLDSEEGVRKAFSELRRASKNSFVIDLSAALRKFAEEKDGELPSSLAELKPFFSGPVNDAMLEQYRMVHSGKAADLPPGEWAVSEKSVVDPDYDRLWKIGPNGYRSDNPRQDQLMDTLREVMRAYQVANGGRRPNAMSDLLPFIKTPEQQAAYQEFGNAMIGGVSKR